MKNPRRYPASALVTPFYCGVQPDGRGSVSMQVEGELDLSTLPRFDRLLREMEGRTHLSAIACERLTFLDCAGLASILAAAARMRKGGQRLRLVGVNGQVARLIEVTDIATLVDLAPAASPDSPRLTEGPTRALRGMGVV